MNRSKFETCCHSTRHYLFTFNSKLLVNTNLNNVEELIECFIKFQLGKSLVSGYTLNHNQQSAKVEKSDKTKNIN